MKKEKIDTLWKWFTKHEHQIIECVEHGHAKEFIVENLNNLILDMGKFSWEIGPGQMKSWFLTISPNGDHKQLLVSKKIIENAPSLELWEFNYCKPAVDWDRRFNIYDNNMDVQPVDASNWKYVAVPFEEEMVKLILEADNITHLDHDTAVNAANLLVTNEIGEETKLGKVLSVSIVNQIDSELEPSKSEIQNLRDLFKS